jgi:prolyl oligopeptidase
MLTRYPERFGALFCTIPLIDMRRYSKLLAGASWIAEYGDPDKPDDWAFLQTYSAYHQADPDAAIRRSCLPPPARMIACIRATRARWPPSCRRWGTRPISMSLPREATATARTTRNARRSPALGLQFLRDKIGWSAAA